jgi:hypothetical protein
MARTVASSRTASSARTAASAHSAATTRPTPANIQVFLEMVDTNVINSIAGVFTPLATQLGMDTDDYDGSPVYSFQMVCQNNDNVTRDVQLLDSNSNVKATLTATASSGYTLYTTTFTPTSGYSVYKISLSANSSNTIQVAAARIVINQTAASKTRIQVPLVARNSGTGFTTDATLRIDQATLTSYSKVTDDRYSLWQYVAANWGTLNPVRTFTFAAVLSNSNAGSVTSASLFNATSTNQVVNSEVTNTGTTLTLVNANFTSDTEFTNNSEFEVRLKTSAGNGRLHRAALYIRLIAAPGAAFKGESYARIAAFGENGIFTTTGTNDQFRQKINSTTGFSNPVLTHESVARESVAGSSGVTTLRPFDGGVNNAGGVGSAVGVATAYTGISTKTRLRGAGTFNLTDGNRVVTRHPLIATGATLIAAHHNVVISWTS